ncbi:porin [Zhongshania arctica]|uniref:Porin n=1 Tax=Zhongshania arctica TaxID=3238302 RepID=A0ABV3TXG7_9GAMM|tara:strand:+ start:1209 stop:2183 length:975 start_codon:yes stop_codon:yes gene_type:complete
MKPQRLPTILILCAAPLAHADVSFYGKANISYQNTKRGIDSNSKQWELNSNASRIGIKGDIPIDDTNISAIIQVEYEVAIDDGETGNAQSLKQRDTFAGLTGSWGTVVAGQMNTATKDMSREVDLFNNLAVGDVKYYLSGENRLKNTIRYSSPRLFDHLSGSIAVVPGEDSSTNQDGPADGTTISVRYDGDGVAVGFAHDQEVNGKNVNRAIAHLEIMNIDLGILIQTSEISKPINNNDEDEEAGVLSLSYHANNKLDFKFQIGHTEIDLFNGDKQLDQIATGVDYRISKSLTAYGYSAQVTSKSSATSTSKDRTTGIGMVLRF